jgi:hypothetical protein
MKATYEDDDVPDDSIEEPVRKSADQRTASVSVDYWIGLGESDDGVHGPGRLIEELVS